MDGASPVICGHFQTYVAPVFRKAKVILLKRICKGAGLLAPSAKFLDPRRITDHAEKDGSAGTALQRPLF